MSTYRAKAYRSQVRRLVHLSATMNDDMSKNMLLNLADQYRKMALVAETKNDREKKSSSSGSWLDH